MPGMWGADRGRRAVLLAIGTSLVAGGLSGCGLVGAVSSPVFQVEAVQVHATPNANNNSATRLDMVFVYEEAAVDMLQSLSAAEWFDRKRQFMLDFPEGIGIRSWEVVPATSLDQEEVPDSLLENKSGDKAVAAFVFADYLSPGAHRARLETRRGIRIELGRDDFTLTPFNLDS